LATLARYAYKVSKEVGLAHDEQDNNTEAFVKVELPVNDLYANEEYKVAHEVMVLQMIARQMNIEPTMLTPISLEEYDSEHENEEL